MRSTIRAGPHRQSTVAQSDPSPLSIQTRAAVRGEWVMSEPRGRCSPQVANEHRSARIRAERCPPVTTPPWGKVGSHSGLPPENHAIAPGALRGAPYRSGKRALAPRFSVPDAPDRERNTRQLRGLMHGHPDQLPARTQGGWVPTAGGGKRGEALQGGPLRGEGPEGYGHSTLRAEGGCG